MTVRELIAVLRQLPAELEVATWEPEGPVAIELAILSGDTVVLGLEMAPSWTVDGADVLWASDDSARRSVERAQAAWSRAKGEWVG